MKKFVIACGLAAMMPVCLAVSANAQRVAFEGFDYADTDLSKEVEKNYGQTVNLDSFAGGEGFAGGWVLSGAGKCEGGNPKISGGKLTNWSQDLTFTRRFANKPNLTNTGVVYASAELKEGLHYDNPEQKSDLNVKFFLGDKIYFGVKYSAEEKGYVTQLSVGADTYTGNTVKRLKDQTYKLKLKMEINDGAADRLYYKVFNTAYAEPAGWDIVRDAELSALSADYIRFKIGGYIPSAVDNILVESCDYQAYSAAKAKGADVEQTDIAALDSELARDDFGAVKSFGDERTEMIFSYFTDRFSYELDEGNYKTKINAQNRGLFGAAEVRNSSAQTLALRAVLAFYDKTGNLLGTGVTDMEIAPYSYGFIRAGFDGEQTLLPANTLVGRHAKLFLWKGDQEPFADEVVLDYKSNDLSGGVMSDIYVSPDNVYGDGSEAHPFATIGEALGYVKEVNQEGMYPSSGITVHVEEGTYKENLNFTSQHSGLPGAEVKLAGEGNTEITGGEYIPISQFSAVSQSDAVYPRIAESARGSVMRVDLKQYGIEWDGNSECVGHSLSQYEGSGVEYDKTPMPRVYVGGEAMTLARYPDSGYLGIDTVESEGTVIANAAAIPETLQHSRFYTQELQDKQWGNAPFMKVFGYFKYNWSDLSVGVRSFENGTIETELPPPYGTKTGAKFYVYNLLEELTSPGEWYIEDSVLYFYPPEGCTEVMISSSQSPAVHMHGCENVRFENIGISGTRANAAEGYSCKNVVFDNCRMSRVSGWGAYLQGCDACEVNNSVINTCGKGGVFLSGGNKTTLAAAQSKAQNNEIYDYGLISKCYSPGIRLDGVGNVAFGNKIHSSEQSAVTFSGNDHVIASNEIYDCLRESDDMGAIYGGRSKIGRGNIIKDNYIHDLRQNDGFYTYGITGVFLDDLLDGETVSGNTFENIIGSGVKVNGGRDNKIINNTFDNVSYTAVEFHAFGLYMNMTKENILNTYEGLSDGLYKTIPYSKYEHLSNLLEDDVVVPKYNVIKDNTVLDTPDWKFIAYSCMTDEEFAAVNDVAASSVAEYGDDELGVIAYEDFSDAVYADNRVNFGDNGGTGWATGFCSDAACTKIVNYYDNPKYNEFYKLTGHGMEFLRQDNKIYRKLAQSVDVGKVAKYLISYDIFISSVDIPNVYDTKFMFGDEIFGGLISDGAGYAVSQANGIVGNGERVEKEQNYTIYISLEVDPYHDSVIKVQTVKKGEALSDTWDVTDTKKLSKNIDGISMRAAGWGTTTYYNNFKIERVSRR